MNRRVLLVEPNYKNKYPPQNLMKLATYFRQVCKDDVRFYKGDLKDFAAQLLLEEFFFGEVDSQNLFAPEKNDAAQKFGEHTENLLEFMRTGKNIHIKVLRGEDYYYEDVLRRLHVRFNLEDFPKFDLRTTRSSILSASTRCSRSFLSRPSTR